MSPSVVVRGYTINGLQAIAVYLLGGMAAGAIAGLLRPLARRPAGAIIVGIVASAPLFYGIIGTIAGFSPWTANNTIALGISVLVFGVGGGLGMREVFYEEIIRETRRKTAGE